MATPRPVAALAVPLGAARLAGVKRVASVRTRPSHLSLSSPPQVRKVLVPDAPARFRRQEVTFVALHKTATVSVPPTLKPSQLLYCDAVVGVFRRTFAHFTQKSDEKNQPAKITNRTAIPKRVIPSDFGTVATSFAAPLPNGGSLPTLVRRKR